MNVIRLLTTGVVLTGLIVCAPLACAQSSSPLNVQDNFTGGSANLQWAPFSHACLTAGNGSGSIPSCTTIQDAANSGALRLTDATNDESGAIISTTPFPSTQGITVTFTTYTYGGDSGGSGKDGADGIGFYLLNGNDASNVIAASNTPSSTSNLWNLGAFGGSLGYSCSNDNSPHDGMTDAYIGLGMDEFGNFLNAGDNTGSGALNSANATSGTGVKSGQLGLSGGSGPDFQPGRIGLRGDGNINVNSLTAAIKALGWSHTVTETDVENVCANGGTFTFATGQNTTSNSTTYLYVPANSTSSTPSVTYSGNLYQQNTSHNGTVSYAQMGSTSSGYTGTGTPFGLTGTNASSSASIFTPITVYKPGASIPATSTMTLPDYAAIPNAYKNLTSATPIAKESATIRGSAVPITYKLTVTEDGLLSLSFSWNGGNFNPVLTNQSIQATNGTMPSSFLFGFGASTGGDNNVHEITCFQATPASLSASSAGINVQETEQIGNGTQVYLAFFHQDNWWGELEAVPLTPSSTTGVAFGKTTWDASCVLTGGACTTTGQTLTAEPPLSSSTVPGRNLIAWDGVDGAGGIPFIWSRLGATEQGWLNSGDSLGQDRVGFLSGVRTNEVNSNGVGEFRARTSVLGDIIDSSPAWVGPPSTDYPNTWQDLTNPSGNTNMPENQATATKYSTFESNFTDRTNIVYEGANDGFMHGFRAGSVNDASVLNDGFELIGYMPQAVMQSIHSSTDPTVDYSSALYAHNYFVDATPGTGDLFYGNTWHTWLVSGLGSGGNAIFALDITDPTQFGSSMVIGEWSNTNSPITCNSDTTTSLCRNDLGQTYGTPQIRRLHNGQWGIIFGNGLNSANGHAGIFVMTIEPTTTTTTTAGVSVTTNAGQISGVYFLDTGVGSPASTSNTAGPNGIAFVTPADLDGDHITDYVYAGDVYGNVWRFDLTSSLPADWGVSTYGNSTPTPLFTTPVTTTSTKVNGNTVTVTDTQPITTQVLALAVASANGTTSRMMIEFGTGSIQPQTNTSNVAYAQGQQTLYGIWDWGLGMTNTPGASYIGLTPGSTGAPTTGNPISVSTLEQQTTTTITGTTENVRTVTTNVPCFTGTTCSDGASGNQFGWYLNLPGFEGVTSVGSTNQTEQVVYSPIETEGAFIVDTTIPSNNSPLTCGSLNNLGYSMALNPATGGAFAQSFFINPNTGTFSPLNGQSISGVGVGATGSPSVVAAGSNFYMVGQTTQSTGFHQQINPQNTAVGHRLTWTEMH